MKLKVCNQKVTITNHEALVSGSVNIYLAEFEFDSIWDEYSKVAVFVAKTKENEVRREAALSKDACVIPWEVLENTGKLKVGVYGILGDKRLPTIYTDDEIILLGAETSEPFEDPTPGIVEQVVAKTAEDRSAAENAADRAVKAAIRQPYPNEATGTWWVWDAEAEAYKDTGISYGGSGGGTTDHTKLTNRNAADQHPMSAITGLEKALEGKQPSGSYLTDKDLDATLKEAGKAADAKAVGDAISSLSEEKVNLPVDTGGTAQNGTSGQILQTNGDGTTQWVDKPEGGGGVSGDYIPVPASAEVGQTIVVKAVDENWKPTEWETVDMASVGIDWQLVDSKTLTADDAVTELEWTGLDCDNIYFTSLNQYGSNVTCTGIYVNGKQICKDFYQFEHQSSIEKNTLLITKMPENHRVEVIGNNYGNIYSNTYDKRGYLINIEKIDSIKFVFSNTLSAQMTLSLYKG